MTSYRRILDANANRAREGLRVIEDAARFLFNDRGTAERAKLLRHDISRAIDQFPHLIEERDTPGDVGTSITTDAESARPNEQSVVIAACKRVSEALRALEEFSKIDHPTIARRFESARYECYEIERRVLARFNPRERLSQLDQANQPWPLCVIISDNVCANRPWTDVARNIFNADVPPACVQLREKHLDDAELLKRTETLLAIAPADVSVIVNDRPDIALMTRAHGVHLGQHDLPCRDVRQLVGDACIIGVSTDNIAHAQKARDDGADYCGVGPMFPTTTKHKNTIVGPTYLKEYIAWAGLPHLAIGGINTTNAKELTQLGCTGIAVSSAVCSADDPATAVNQLHAALGMTKPACPSTRSL